MVRLVGSGVCSVRILLLMGCMKFSCVVCRVWCVRLSVGVLL